jgi:hypothetical protein
MSQWRLMVMMTEGGQDRHLGDCVRLLNLHLIFYVNADYCEAFVDDPAFGNSDDDGSFVPSDDGMDIDNDDDELVDDAVGG